MATTKNYKKMSEKKLNALLETASAEEAEKIQHELDLRAEAAANAVETLATEEAEDALSAEEEAAIVEAEKNGGLNPLYDKNAAKAEKKESNKPKLSDEELAEINAECRKNIGHKCEVVPFNTATYIPGYVATTSIDKRAGNVMYVVKCEDGRSVRKVHNSELIHIFDEVVELPKSKRGRVATAKERLSDEELQEKVAEASENIGKALTFSKGEGEEKETITGRIIAVVADKRVDMVLYKIAVPQEDGTNRIVHKSAFGNLVFAISDTRDEEGEVLYKAHVERLARKNASLALNPEERYKAAMAALEKAQTAFERAQANLEKAQARAAEMKVAFDASLELESKKLQAEDLDEAMAAAAEDEDNEDLA